MPESDLESKSELSWKRGDDPKRSATQTEFVAYRHYLRDAGLLERFRELEKPAAASTAFQAALAGGVFAMAIAAAMRSPSLIPIALVGIGFTLRSLNNVLHDASHGNVVSRPSPVTRWMLTAPLFESFDRYRRLHLAHHAYLGDPERDPDIIILPPSDSALVRYVHLFASPRVWLASALGPLPSLRGGELAATIGFWTLLLALVALAFGGRAALYAGGLWMLSRATSYHAIRCFTELSDHVGLEPGTVLSFTRNSPRNLLTFLLHPHHDNYHIVHHFAPRVPLANMRAAHELLMGYAPYAEGHQCDGYFFGKVPVIKSWVRGHTPCASPSLKTSSANFPR